MLCPYNGRDYLVERNSTLTSLLRREPIALARHRSHPPCSQLDIHPAAVVSNDAGGLLLHRFIPYSLARAGLLSVAVVVDLTQPSPKRRGGRGRPRLLFREATVSDEDRESGSSSRFHERRTACLSTSPRSQVQVAKKFATWVL